MPMPADRVGQAAERQVQYDQAWLYGYVRAMGQREQLPAEIEQAGPRLTSSSWPVSLALAWYYTVHDPTRVDGLARQFATLEGRVRRQCD